MLSFFLTSFYPLLFLLFPLSPLLLSIFVFRKYSDPAENSTQGCLLLYRVPAFQSRTLETFLRVYWKIYHMFLRRIICLVMNAKILPLFFSPPSVSFFFLSRSLPFFLFAAEESGVKATSVSGSPLWKFRDAVKWSRFSLVASCFRGSLDATATIIATHTDCNTSSNRKLEHLIFMRRFNLSGGKHEK